MLTTHQAIAADAFCRTCTRRRWTHRLHRGQPKTQGPRQADWQSTLGAWTWRRRSASPWAMRRDRPRWGAGAPYVHGGNGTRPYCGHSVRPGCRFARNAQALERRAGTKRQGAQKNDEDNTRQSTPCLQSYHRSKGNKKGTGGNRA